MPRIRRIQIKNFRSISKLDIRTEDLTVFVGDNDCGKSNILRALNLFFNGETNPSEPFKFQNDWNRFATTGAKQAKQIDIELELELPDGYRATNGDFIRWKKAWRADGLHNGSADYTGIRLVDKKRGGGTAEQEVTVPAKSNVHTLLRKIEFEYVPAVRSAEFFRKLRGRIFNVIAEVAEQGMRETSGTFEQAIAGHVADLIADISKTLGDEARISMPNDLSVIFERLDFLNASEAISLDYRGDGIKGRYIPLILKFIADQKRTLNTQGTPPHTFIWAYEEPENNLEFKRAQQLAAEFCELADGDLTQVLLTTHSPVFYNLAADAEERAALHISLRDSSEGTKCEDAAGSASSLDERMGVMPIVAPYVQKAERQIELLASRQTEIEELLNRQKLPALFVEGVSDFKVFRALLNANYPNWRQQINLVEPPTSGAGASYVADHLVSWNAVQKHQPVPDRLKAFGVLDNDLAGKEAKRKVTEISSQGRLVHALTLPKTASVVAAVHRGIIIPVALEECYHPDWWVYADGQGWLEDRDRASVLSNAAMSRILNGEATFEEIAGGGELDLIVRKKVRTESKTNWAAWVARRSEGELLTGFSGLIRTIDEGLRFVGVVSQQNSSE